MYGTIYSFKQIIFFAKDQAVSSNAACSRWIILKM